MTCTKPEGAFYVYPNVRRSGQGRREDGDGTGDAAAARGACGDGSGRGVWDRRSTSGISYPVTKQNIDEERGGWASSWAS
jgi:hypothetical protein